MLVCLHVEQIQNDFTSNKTQGTQGMAALGTQRAQRPAQEPRELSQRVAALGSARCLDPANRIDLLVTMCIVLFENFE